MTINRWHSFGADCRNMVTHLSLFVLIIKFANTLKEHVHLCLAAEKWYDNMDAHNTKWVSMGIRVVRYSILVEMSQRQSIYNGTYPASGHVSQLHYPLFRRRPAGLPMPVYERKEGKGNKNETITLRMQSYKPISPTTDRYSSVATFRQVPCTRKLHHDW